MAPIRKETYVPVPGIDAIDTSSNGNANPRNTPAPHGSTVSPKKTPSKATPKSALKKTAASSTPKTLSIHTPLISRPHAFKSTSVPSSKQKKVQAQVNGSNSKPKSKQSSKLGKKALSKETVTASDDEDSDEIVDVEDGRVFSSGVNGSERVDLHAKNKDSPVKVNGNPAKRARKANSSSSMSSSSRASTSSEDSVIENMEINSQAVPVINGNAKAPKEKDERTSSKLLANRPQSSRKQTKGGELDSTKSKDKASAHKTFDRTVQPNPARELDVSNEKTGSSSEMSDTSSSEDDHTSVDQISKHTLSNRDDQAGVSCPDPSTPASKRVNTTSNTPKTPIAHKDTVHISAPPPASALTLPSLSSEKQIWHITIPAGIPVTALTEVPSSTLQKAFAETDAATKSKLCTFQEKTPILKHDGNEYILARGTATEAANAQVMIPAEDDDHHEDEAEGRSVMRGYKRLKRDVDAVWHVRLAPPTMPLLPEAVPGNGGGSTQKKRRRDSDTMQLDEIEDHDRANKDGGVSNGEEDSSDDEVPLRPLPEGMKMRWLPSGCAPLPDSEGDYVDIEANDVNNKANSEITPVHTADSTYNTSITTTINDHSAQTINMTGNTNKTSRQHKQKTHTPELVLRHRKDNDRSNNLDANDRQSATPKNYKFDTKIVDQANGRDIANKKGRTGEKSRVDTDANNVDGEKQKNKEERKRAKLAAKEEKRKRKSDKTERSVQGQGSKRSEEFRANEKEERWKRKEEKKRRKEQRDKRER